MSESDSVYESIASRMNGFLYRCRNDDDYTMLNMTSNVKRLTGYAAGDLIDNRRYSYMSLIFSEDAPAVDDAVEKAVKNGEDWCVDYRLSCSNGSLRWVSEYGGAVTDEQGNVIYLEGVVIDIQSRRDNEEKMAALSHDIAKETEQIMESLKMLRLVSINAGIEAARAGETGNAFAAVADAVRRLADNTNSSAAKITGMMQKLEKLRD